MNPQQKSAQPTGRQKQGFWNHFPRPLRAVKRALMWLHGHGLPDRPVAGAFKKLPLRDK